MALAFTPLDSLEAPVRPKAGAALDMLRGAVDLSYGPPKFLVAYLF